MPRIALLIQETPTLEDGNYLRFARSLAAQNHDVTLIPIDTLGLANGAVTGAGFTWSDAIIPGNQFPTGQKQKINHDLVWVLSIGERSTFLDKFQLLFALSQKTKVINSLESIMHLKSKYFLATQSDAFPTPETHASSNAKELEQIILDKGGKWIIKPPAGSLGRDVFLVDGADSNLRTILAHLCGPENNQYTMLQRYVSEIEQGEKRVLIAGVEVIDQYQRFADGDHRTNVSQGARIQHCDLTIDERNYCNTLAKVLLNHGVYFAGVDLAYPWLIEVNVINPGGLLTIEELNGTDHSKSIVSAVLRASLSI